MTLDSFVKYVIPLGVLLSPLAHAISDAQYGSIEALGELNGIALQCGYIEQTQRMKRILVATLPKRRALGLAFDDATNKSFLRFMEQKTSCMSEQELSGRVDEAITRLKTEFSGD
jgi:hypothetical protein